MRFKRGDKVRVVINLLAPNAVGKVGTIVNTAITTDKVDLYKVRLDGQMASLKGWAEEDCLELVEGGAQ